MFSRGMKRSTLACRQVVGVDKSKSSGLKSHKPCACKVTNKSIRKLRKLFFSRLYIPVERNGMELELKELPFSRGRAAAGAPSGAGLFLFGTRTHVSGRTRNAAANTSASTRRL